jgi:hypothetical protein
MPTVLNDVHLTFVFVEIKPKASCFRLGELFKLEFGEKQFRTH